MIAKIKTLILCIGFLAVAADSMMAEVTSSFGLNFISGDNQKIENEAAGFSKDGYAQPTTWFNLSGGNGRVSCGNNVVVWTSYGPWNSGVEVNSNTSKLLYNYLDDAVNGGRTKAAVKISGLPRDKKYSVALLLSGDADNDGFNGKYSPVWINGEIYSFTMTDGAPSLVSGDVAKSATTWGDRRKPAADGPAGFVEGTNVMFVEGVFGSDLTITSALDSQNVSRLTIAGVQVWITDESVENNIIEPSQDSDVISVNFASGYGSVSGVAGLVMAGGWHNEENNNGTLNALMVVNANGTDSATCGATLTYGSSTTYRYVDVQEEYLKGYLDDRDHDGVAGATVRVDNIPFSRYSLIVYMATDTEGQFKPVKVNGIIYAGSTELTSVGYAKVQPSLLQNSRISNWGESKRTTSQYGVNAIRVDGLLGNLTIQGGKDETFDGIRFRGGIAAIQIVNTGDPLVYTYSEAGVNYPLIFRGTTDGNWAELSNWYIGYRTNGDNTDWFSYKGERVPGAKDSNEWSPTLIDGSLFAENFVVDEDGYKVVFLSDDVSYEGWNSRIKVANGVHLKIANIRKLQSANADNNGGWIKVDATSKMTITSLGTQGDNAFGGRFEVLGVLTVENDFTAKGNNPGYLYTLGLSGIVQYEGLSSTRTHKIQSVILDVGNSGLNGRCIVSRKLIGFTSANAQTFTYEASGVVVSIDGISAKEAPVLSEVGDYKFEMKEDGYYVSYVAYAEEDEIVETVWTNATGDGSWSTEANWSHGLPAEGAAAVVEVSGEVTLSIPENGVSVGTLTVKGNGKVTLAGGKITAEGIAVKANLSASDATLELAPMDIAEGVVVEYTANGDANNSEKVLPVLTGEGVFSKSGPERLTVNADLACEPQLVWNAGTLRFTESIYAKSYNVVAKDGAMVQVGIWTGSLIAEGNVFTFKGGSTFWLYNGNSDKGSNIKGSIIIDSSIEKPVVFKGSSHGNNSDIQASIKGNGVVKILRENNYFTISGVISDGDGEGDKLSILYEADNVEVFSGENTFTGGFNLRNGKTAKITNAKALGTGIATIDGTLQVGGSGLGSKVTGSGVIAATENETVQFVDGNAIIPSYENVLTINGKVGGTPIIDISTMDLANGKRFNLLKVNAGEKLPEPFTDANFVNGESNGIPAGWVVALTPDGLGYCLKREAFVIRIR